MKRLLPLLLLLGLGPLQGGSASSQSVLDSMGRLEHTPTDCSRNLVIKKQNGDCARVVIDQIDREFLSVSFYARGAERDSSNKLSFGGTTNRGMVCERTRCRISGPIRLELSNASEVDYDANGIATGLPSAWPVNGSCSISSEAVRCEAKAFTGEQWQAQASF
ncbi:MAG: hypothetical protein VKJ87_06100 [Synechococcus sp.]|nr:hypothetical protein [Synechococcus sp.]